MFALHAYFLAFTGVSFLAFVGFLVVGGAATVKSIGSAFEMTFSKMINVSCWTLLMRNGPTALYINLVSVCSSAVLEIFEFDASGGL